LRALNVKPGKHEVELKFFPKSIDRTETIAYCAYALLLLAIITAVLVEARKKKKQTV